MHIKQSKYFFILISFFLANTTFACEVSNIQELPVELIEAIAYKLINQNVPTHKETFGELANFSLVCKQFNEIKKSLLNSNYVKELNWKLISQRLKNYDEYFDLLKKSHSQLDYRPQMNALHKAVVLSDHNFLSRILPKLFMLKDEEPYKRQINFLLEHDSNFHEYQKSLNTVLGLACWRAEFDCAKLLLAHGANPNINPEYGRRISILEEVEKCIYEWWCKNIKYDVSLERYVNVFQLLLSVTESTSISETISTIRRRGWENFNPMEPMSNGERAQIIHDCHKTNLKYNEFIRQYFPASLIDQFTKK